MPSIRYTEGNSASAPNNNGIGLRIHSNINSDNKAYYYQLLRLRRWQLFTYLFVIQGYNSHSYYFDIDINIPIFVYKSIIISKYIMQTTDIQAVKDLILSNNIVTFKQIEECLNASRMTIIRRLRGLPYLSSYSHKGKYYTLRSIPKFSKEGLWSYNSVHFSEFDTLINTCLHFVNTSESGYSVKELDDKLDVGTKLSLIELYKRKDLYREKCNGEYVYFNKHFPRRKQQLTIRHSQNDTAVFNIDKLSGHIVTDKLKAAIILFYSILNEKQRRLYAGLESLKIGHGGDTLISKLLDIDPETVSKGRKELNSGDFEKDRVRKQGAGRPGIKKNS